MFTENGLTLDLDDVGKVIGEADVFGIGFRLFGRRLFVDTRADHVDGPFIATVEPLSNIQERMFWLGQNRPRFGVPQRFAFFFWPGSLRFLQESGVWDLIRCRVLDSGSPSVAADADRALADLRRLERQATLDAITGEHHRSLWESPSSRHNR